jgi:hypothetical protein
MNDIDPNMAVELGGDDSAVDLSKEAIEQRDKERKLRAAAHWARSMNRAFKGITRLRRRDYVRIALVREGLVDEDAV